jgi:cytochrome c-type biogenesis protein
MELILPAFIAGLLTFLAPCTLPLIPGYIGFISGVSVKDIQDGHLPVQARKRIFLNGLVYVFGFSIVFVGLGVIFGLFGNALIDLRFWLTKLGGICIMFFGFYLAGAHKLRMFQFFSRDARFHITSSLRPGTPLSSFLFGATFAFGWTPCVGPILGTMLLLVSTKGTITEGALLLSVFSLGLGLPFLAVALGISHALEYIKKITPFLQLISIIGGLFLIMIGVLLLTGYMAVWVDFFYQLFSWMSYDKLYTYL